MNSKGQSALEYLLTYGWALIVIAVVVGLLVFILSSTTAGGVVCTAQSTQFNLQTYNVQSGTDKAIFEIQNATGKTISGIIVSSKGDFAADTNDMSPGSASSFSNGKTFVVKVSGPAVTGNFTNGEVQVQYDYNSGIITDVNFAIKCSGSA